MKGSCSIGEFLVLILTGLIMSKTHQGVTNRPEFIRHFQKHPALVLLYQIERGKGKMLSFVDYKIEACGSTTIIPFGPEIEGDRYVR